MRFLVTSLLILTISAIFFAGCTPKQDAAIREKSDLGMGEMVKAKDRGIEGNLTASLSSDPTCLFYHIKATVSHDIVTLTGTVKTEKQKQHAEDVVKNTQLERIKEIINEIQVDPNADETPFEELY
jgi:osmotically-inducible protein OsmY